MNNYKIEEQIETEIRKTVDRLELINSDDTEVGFSDLQIDHDGTMMSFDGAATVTEDGDISGIALINVLMFDESLDQWFELSRESVVVWENELIDNMSFYNELV